MQRIPLLDFYLIGSSDRVLREIVTPNHSVKGLLTHLQGIFSDLDVFSFPVTKSAISYGELNDLITKLSALPGETLLKDAGIDFKKFKEGYQMLNNVLTAEAKSKTVFAVTEKRIEISKLIDNPEKLFGASIFSTLNDLAKFDLQEAGKCIAFERPTAAAFHLLRAVEGLLREYFCSIVRRDRPKTLLWGKMLEILEARRVKPPQELLNNLRSIKDDFRNPTQHPDMRYDMDAAQDLFMRCIDAVNKIQSLINKGR